MSKRKIKQEVDLVFLFELLSIVKCKQSDAIYVHLMIIAS